MEDKDVNGLVSRICDQRENMTLVIKQGGMVPVCKCEQKHITKSAVSGQRAFILSLYS